MKLWLGLTLVASSLLVLFFTFSPVIKHEIEYQVRQFGEPATIAITRPSTPEFNIIIPKLKINSPVIKNVDPFDANIYQQALIMGVAHAKGSSFPGEKGSVFIFSHSSVNFLEALKYNSIFYLLPKLNKGDVITVHFKGVPYEYYVFDKKIVEADQVEYLSDEKSNDLILMTCYPPGTSLKRFLVIAIPKK